MGGRASFVRRSGGSEERGPGGVFGAGSETEIAYPVCRAVRLSKTRGADSLTGIGGGGGGEGWMGVGGVRHHVTGRWGRRLCGFRG